MATHDDDNVHDGAIPEPDAAALPGELAKARRFADLVDKALAGRTPPAMPADDRALLEVATVIRATSGHAELSAARRHALVEDALRLAIRAPAAGAAPLVVPAGQAPSPRGRAAAPWPWLVTGASTLIAAAALAMLWLRAPSPIAPPARPAEWTSRSADSLVGPITREHAGDAGARIDAIFADRLDGFRARQLARGGTP